jgi:hypothetical protein
MRILWLMFCWNITVKSCFASAKGICRPTHIGSKKSAVCVPAGNMCYYKVMPL